MSRGRNGPRICVHRRSCAAFQHVEMAIAALKAGKHVYCEKPVGITPESIRELLRAAGFGGTLLWVDDPPGRTNMDGYSLTYDYPNAIKLSFTQVFFHPSGLPGGGQYAYVYGTEGAVDLNSATFYPRKGKPEVLAQPEQPDQSGRDAHIAAFYESIRTGKKPAADAVTREAISRKRVMNWSDLGVDI